MVSTSRINPKTVGLIATVCALGYVLGNYVASDYCIKKSFEPEVYELPMSVSIVVTAAHEPDELLEISLSSLRSQSLLKCEKNSIEIVMVAGDGVNLDLAGKYCDKVILEHEKRGNLPPGKLTARHIGICEAGGDIIVAVDADTYYPPGWLAQLLKPYVKDRKVVATHGVCVCLDELTCPDVRTLLGWWMFCAYYGINISGRNSSFLKDAYFMTGGFDLTRQRKISELLWEEEFAFRKRLAKIGRVVFVPTAVAISLNYRRFRKDHGLRRTVTHDVGPIPLSLRCWLRSLVSP